MGERKFTLIELHFDGETQFGPGRIGEALPALGRGADVETDEGSEIESDVEESADDEGGRSPIGIVVALAVLVGIAAAVRKYRGGDEEAQEIEEFETSDEPDVIVDDD